MNSVINHKNNSCIWYHTTPNDRVEKILREGLRINSDPGWQEEPEPWIYVSTEPFMLSPETTTFEVDLSFLGGLECGWPFTEPGAPDWEDRWQLRVFKDIPAKYLKVLSS